MPRFVSDIHCSIVKPNRSSDVICSVSRRRDIVLRAWNYPGVQNFSRTDPLYRNSYSFTIPVVSTLSSATCSKFLDLLQSDLKGDLPFQVCVLRVCLSYAPLFFIAVHVMFTYVFLCRRRFLTWNLFLRIMVMRRSSIDIWFILHSRVGNTLMITFWLSSFKGFLVCSNNEERCSTHT